MIVDPDFLDHWRTRMVVDALGDEMAPMYIMRLWAHCQSRKADRHAMPAAGLKAQCRAQPHDAAAFEQALVDAGFVKREGEAILVLGWAEQNAALLAAWENGAKGGRPRKKPKQNPAVTHGQPDANPTLTHGEPTANPSETQTKPIRVDKSREEEKEGTEESVRDVVGRATRSTTPKGARRCPAGYVVTESTRIQMRAECPGVDLDREERRFRDHTFKQAYSDWDATFRNWIRNAYDRLPAARLNGHHIPDTAARDAEARRLLGFQAKEMTLDA